MHTGNRRTQKRILTSALALATAGILLPASAFAEDSGPISPMAPWQECLQGAAPAGQNIAPGEMDTEPNFDEVILDFDDDLSHNAVLGWAGAQGLHVELNSPAADAPNVYIARVAEGAVPYVKACLAKRGADGDIEAIEENFEYKLFAEGFEVARDADGASTKPNDPLYQFQWHFDQVNAEEAWKTSTGRDVVVAVIDTGVAVKDDANRGIKAAKDLAGTSIVDGYDFVDKSDFVFDGHGHGTHVAGTIAQTTNNKYGVAGLAYNAKIMGLRVLNSRGFGQVADIADAVRFAADNGAQVINMSLGGPCQASCSRKRSTTRTRKASPSSPPPVTAGAARRATPPPTITRSPSQRPSTTRTRPSIRSGAPSSISPRPVVTPASIITATTALMASCSRP